jgi:amino acid transporter
MSEKTNQSPPQSLKKDCLSYPEVIAQSVSVIAPATVPAAVVGLVYASAGNGMWLSFLLGLIGLVIVAFNVNQFAKRSASPGSLYTYIVKGLGPTAGVLSGWALLLGYIATGMSTLCGFAIFAEIIIGSIGVHLPVLGLFVVCVAVACFIAYRDIQLSAKLMLVFELLAMLVILTLGVLLWKHTGFAIDTDQFTLKGTTPSGILLGVVLVVFAFSGFESATSLGDEARNPLKTIPRAVTHSTIIAGVFFLFMAYVITLAFQGTGADLGKEEAPLNFLAPRVGLGFFGTLINFGALLSFFACTLACINSTARIVFSMSRHGLFHDFLGEAHHINKTPHVAVILTALITLLVPVGVLLTGMSPFDAQGHFGTVASFGFLLIYFLVSLAAPLYLKKLKVLRFRDVLFSVLAIAFVALPVLGTLGIPGSTLFPPPSYPDNVFVWIFVAYMAVGIGWLVIQRYRSPKMIHTVKTSVDEIHERFEAASRPR